MTDGAHMGIRAKRALETILGGKEQPSEEERETPEEVRARIEAIPLFEGEKPWDMTADGDEAYSMATDALAHAFLVLIEEDPTLLEPQPYPETYPDGEPMPEWTKGKSRDISDVLWDAMEERWPHADEWIGGASGFMVGFAANTAMYVTQSGYAPNPAIMTIEVPE